MKKIVLLLIAAFTMTLVLDSCSVQKRYHRKGFTVNWNNTSVKMKKNRQVIQTENIQEETIVNNDKKPQRLTKTYNERVTQDIAANVDVIHTPSVMKEVEHSYKKENSKAILNQNTSSTKSVSKGSLKSTKKAVKKLIKSMKKNQQNDSKTDTIIYLLLILLVPFGTTIAMYLYEGSWTGRVTTNVLLTLLCGLPGFIHALVVIFGNK